MSGNRTCVENWVSNLNGSLAGIFDTSRLTFTIQRREPRLMIRPKFNLEGGNEFGFPRCFELVQSMLEHLKLKVSLMESKKADQLQTVRRVLGRVQAYFEKFKDADIPFSTYIELRKQKHPALIKQAEEIERRKDSPPPPELIETIIQIEEKELSQVFSGAQLRFSIQ
jgi:hypothetical protein